ncbi:MAG: PD-(D/E)XK nuclease family protein, partial [Solirubrobacterales bacterium]|nr:PD-(D/E)XK nuclease family protein [Solirubrobacterales bacterium]
DALRAEPGLWLGEPVLFYGFSDLTAVQAEVVKALAAAASVTVSLSTDKTGRVGVADIVAQRLRAAADSGVQVTEEEVVPEAEPEGSPASLGASLFTPAKSGSVHDDGRVRILSGSGSRAASELAAGAVVDLIEKGTAPDLIAVVRPNADDDALLESILRSAGIDVARAESAPLGATTLGRALLGACRLAFAPKTSTADDAMVWIRAVSGPDAAIEVDLVDAALRRKGVTSGEQALTAWKKASGSDGATISKLANHTNNQDFADALVRGADELMRAASVERGQPLKRDMLFDASVVSTVAKASADLATLFDRSRPQLMIDELAGLDVDVDTGASRPGSVLLTDASSIRGRRLDAVVVHRLEHGLIPASTGQDPFLGDVPADCLGESALAGDLGLGPKLRSASARQEAGEKERFAACFSRAKESVVLVSRIFDDAGSKVAASAYLDEVVRLLGRSMRDLAKLEAVRPAGALRPTSKASGERTLLRAERVHQETSVAPQLPDHLGLAARATIEERLDKVVSPSRLEAYCECPLSWLGQNLLNPREMEPEGEPTFRGTVVHFALQKAVEAAIEKGDGRIEPKVMDAARQAILDAIEEKRADAANTLAATVALKRAEILSLQWLEKECDRDWPARAIDAEFSFGTVDDDGNEVTPPLDLGDGIKLRGTVDRVDVLGEIEDPERLIMVRDYKSGTKIWEQTKWDPDRRLQAPLYLLAAIQLLGGVPAASMYESVKSLRMRGAILEGTPGAAVLGVRNQKSDSVTPDELQLLIDAAKERARTAVRGIMDGNLGPDPAHCSSGYGCRYEWLCRTVR